MGKLGKLTFRSTKMSFTTIIYAHPYDQSFNNGILRRVQQLLDEKGEKYRLIDLYADGFNPAYTKKSLPCSTKAKPLTRWFYIIRNS